MRRTRKIFQWIQQALGVRPLIGWRLNGLVLATITITGCANLFSQLRPGLDGDGDPVADIPYYEQGTAGGMFPEQGFLGTRGIASGSGGNPEGDPSWISPQQSDEDARDYFRGAPTYSEFRNLPPPIKRNYDQGRVTRENFVDQSQDAGSLWASNGQTNYFFIKNRVKGVGDIITIQMEEPLVKDVAMEIARTLDEEEMQAELGAAQERIRVKTVDAAKAKGGTSARKPASTEGGENKAQEEEEEIEIPEATLADVDVTQSMGIKAGEVMMAEIIGRYPNGNYKIRGTKRVPYRGGTRFVNVVAVAKSADLDDAETLSSGKLYEYRLNAHR